MTDANVPAVPEPEVPTEVIEEDRRGAISEPGKLMRIAVMLRELQEELRRTAVDDPGRDRLKRIHERALEQLTTTLSDDLAEELSTFTLPFDEGIPSESEIGIAQAQLIGWLEGLFQGIQAAIATQQMEARAQLEQMRRGHPGGPGRELPDGRRQSPPTGQYL